MRGSEFAEFKAFAAVAEHGSFVRASEELGLTASAMSQTIRTLERRLGVRLLHRTTRSVSLTDAGTRLLARLEPALQELDAATREIEDFKQKPSGTLRLVTPRIAYVDHLQPILVGFYTAYPEVTLDITVSDSVTDIVAHGYDCRSQDAPRLLRHLETNKPLSRIATGQETPRESYRTSPSSAWPVGTGRCWRVDASCCRGRSIGRSTNSGLVQHWDFLAPFGRVAWPE